MQLACALPPTVDTADHVVLAEELGYATAWLYDTPALQADVWMALALAGARTRTIRLGPGVLVPSLRHPVVTASAIATLVGVVGPGRVAVGVGTGFTGRRALGQRPLRWNDVQRYVLDVRRLLTGDVAVVDGAATRLLHGAGQVPSRPVDVPFLLGASGPRGVALAAELGCGVLTTGLPPDVDLAGVDEVAMVAFGTVLDDGEDPASPRVLRAAGPAVAVGYHALWERGATALDQLPGGARYRELVDALPAAERHLHVHEGHLTELNAIDRQVITSAALRPTTLTCRAGELAGRLEELAVRGVTEVAFQPMGDVPAELRRFAAAAGLGSP